MLKTYTTIVRIWSRYGHTPITKRTGNFCDELVFTTIHCTDPEHALAEVAALKACTEHAFACHFNMPDYPNQNTRSNFCHCG